MADKKKVKKTVKEIMARDKKARNDDMYLFYQVAKTLVPSVAGASFEEAFKNHDIPKMETVTRARRWVQEYYPELAADVNVEAARELEEENYKEAFTHG